MPILFDLKWNYSGLSSKNAVFEVYWLIEAFL